MSYETAPATRLLATHCIACGRPLVDAVSVNAGMGPDCREKYGYNIQAAPEARAEANKLVHALASADEEPSTAMVAGTIRRLFQLGFLTLGKKIGERFSAVDIEQSGSTLTVRFGWSPEAVKAIHTLPYKRWDPIGKAWEVRESDKRQLWAALRTVFAGCIGMGPKGPFVI